MPENEYKLPEEIGNEEHFSQAPTEGHTATQKTSEPSEPFKEINEKLDAILAALSKEGAIQ